MLNEPGDAAARTPLDHQRALSAFLEKRRKQMEPAPSATPSAKKDHKFKQGYIEHLRVGSRIRVMRETEVEAFNHLHDPNSPRFVPAAAIGSLLYWGCV